MSFFFGHRISTLPNSANNTNASCPRSPLKEQHLVYPVTITQRTPSEPPSSAVYLCKARPVIVSRPPRGCARMMAFIPTRPAAKAEPRLVFLRSQSAAYAEERRAWRRAPLREIRRSRCCVPSVEIWTFRRRHGASAPTCGSSPVCVSTLWSSWRHRHRHRRQVTDRRVTFSVYVRVSDPR